MQMKTHYDFKAPYDWKYLPALVPSEHTMNMVKSWNIAWWKAKKKAERMGA